jgi:sortase A
MATYWFERHTGSRLQQLTSQLHSPVQQVALTANNNRLIIPAMLLNIPINEGKDLNALRTGPWRRPNGSTPAQGGNTIIVGHRFTYTNPRGSFYYLNKLQLNDEVGIFWQGKRYVYKVSNIQVVPPTDTAIELASSDTRLTLYTCTPLWLPKDRLVVTALLEHNT